VITAYGKTYGYDSLDRLTSYHDGATMHTYRLDATGNRTQQVVGSVINLMRMTPMAVSPATGLTRLAMTQ
jgi:uncharacterized protein RhaS with RHS repeats